MFKKKQIKKKTKIKYEDEEGGYELSFQGSQQCRKKLIEILKTTHKEKKQ